MIDDRAKELWDAYTDGWARGARLGSMEPPSGDERLRFEYENGHRHGRHDRDMAWRDAALRLGYDWKTDR